ncbi:MAG: hypothetical protein U0798_04315 [Gemmataceae bacterium]
MLSSLVLPIVISGVALFIASFVSWMVLHLHNEDWKKFPNEDAVMSAVGANAAEGNYMVPGMTHRSEMMTPEFQQKFKTGPRFTMTILPMTNMGRNLGLTFVYFLAISFTLGYLGSIAFQPGASFMNVFRFIFTASLPMFLAGYLAHSIWFRIRVVGHIIESIAYAVIVGLIFAGMWPK